MKAIFHICDNCYSADGDCVPAAGKYTVESGTYDACETHLEEAEGYGFACQQYSTEGNPEAL